MGVKGCILVEVGEDFWIVSEKFFVFDVMWWEWIEIDVCKFEMLDDFFFGFVDELWWVVDGVGDWLLVVRMRLYGGMVIYLIINVDCNCWLNEFWVIVNLFVDG